MYKSDGCENKKIVEPIFVIGAPRSGTTILFNSIALDPKLWHVPGESHSVFEGPLDPKPNYRSNRCTEQDVTFRISREIVNSLYTSSVNYNEVFEDPQFLMRQTGFIGRALRKAASNTLGATSKISKKGSIELVEKTPKNSLRISFLNEIFENAKFIWNKRNPKDNIDSLISGWYEYDEFGPFSKDRFRTYTLTDLDLEDKNDNGWCFALVPGWKKYKSSTVPNVCALQYHRCNRTALDDLKSIGDERIFEIKHEDFVSDPLNKLHIIYRWLNMDLSEVQKRFCERLPQVNQVAHDQYNGNKLRYPSRVEDTIDRHEHISQLSRDLGY